MNASSYGPFFQSAFTGFIGIASKDITPPPGIYAGNWGASKYDFAYGVHRPLMLTCMTIQSSKKEKPLVIISVDLGWWKSVEDEWFVREGILTACSLEPSDLMLCLSHTHSGPGLYRGDAGKPGGELIEPYLTFIKQVAVDAVKHAISTALPAILTWNYGKCNLARNRDLREENSKRIVVGFNPAKTADDTLLVGRITDDRNRIIATIVNYACHPTTLAWDNRLISPDYIGSMRELIEYNTDAPCLFLQGASGDLAPAEHHIGDADIADKHGYQLGYAVLSTLKDMLPPGTQLQYSNIVESGAALAVWERSAHITSSSMSVKMIDVPYSLKPMPTVAEIQKELEQCKNEILKERLSRKLAIQKAIGNNDIAAAPLWVWKLGDSFLIGQPNEAYSCYQQQLRSQLPFHAIAVMNIVNGYAGYLPPVELYNEDIYAVWQTPFAPGSLELLTETSLLLAKELIRQSKEND